jgi:hypothetical protein
MDASLETTKAEQRPTETRGQPSAGGHRRQESSLHAQRPNTGFLTWGRPHGRERPLTDPTNVYAPIWSARPVRHSDDPLRSPPPPATRENPRAPDTSPPSVLLWDDRSASTSPVPGADRSASTSPVPGTAQLIDRTNSLLGESLTFDPPSPSKPDCVDPTRAPHHSPQGVPLHQGTGSRHGAAFPSPDFAPDSSFPLVLPPFPTNGMPSLVLQDLVSQALAWTPPTPGPPAFRFEWSLAAADHNLDILRQHGGDLARALQAQPFSTLSLGSEFRPVHILEPLCGRHPLWPRVRQYLTTGVECPLLPLAEPDRLRDLHLNLR